MTGITAGVVVVTGAGGALGRTIVTSFLEKGYHVAALDRSEHALHDASGDWTARGFERFHVIACDQTDRERVDAAMEEAVSAHGPFVGVVANAGYAKFGSFLDMPARDWQRHVDVNLTGTFHICQSAARHLATARGGGWITVISSGLALYHSDQVSAYCTTKAALLTMIRSAAAELGVHRIRVNAVLPGVVDTAMTRGMLEQDGVLEGVLAKTPLGRLGSESDIADAVQYLASTSARWVTGASVLIDGGQSLYGQPTWVTQDRRIPHEPVWVPGYPPAP